MRVELKRQLGLRLPESVSPRGATMLIYHRVGGDSSDERDVSVRDFEAQLAILDNQEVISMDAALNRLAAGDSSPSTVLTFDDGFRDVYDNAFPRLRERGLPFTIYVATAFVGGTMHWDGSTAKAAGPALTWDQLEEMVQSGLCTIGNHTHTHARPESLTIEELDTCSAVLRDRLSVKAAHFAYTWGVPVQGMEGALRERFRSAATGVLGRNVPGVDPMRLARVPVRRTDPIEFFEAKFRGALRAERAYARIVALGKRLGARA